MIFKYTVANKEGKKLSGTVEAPNENTARTELNNLGFAIIMLQETREAPKIDAGLSKFIFEAIDKNSKLISGTIPAKNEEDGFKKLETEYSLTVNALWPEGSTPEQIDAARKKGQERLQTKLIQPAPAQNQPNENPEKLLEQQKQEAFTKNKIEIVLKEVNELLKNFDTLLDNAQKAEINKRIDKLLRIKNSTNQDYILTTANELLEFIRNQEKTLTQNTHEEKRFTFALQTKKMLDELNRSARQKTLTEDIVERIGNWQKGHLNEPQKISGGAKLINSILQPIKDFFHTPPEIINIKEQIKAYNRQIFEFLKLYFKEPTPEYKEKVKNSIKTVWQARKKAKENLRAIKKMLKTKRREGEIQEHLFLSFTRELNALTGWLLAFYLIYYFIGLYLNTKNFNAFGINGSIKGLQIYQTTIFKYILVTIFILHTSTSLKLNFFKNSVMANFLLPPFFVFGTIIAILNF